MILNQKTGGHLVFCLVVGATDWTLGAIMKKSTPFTRLGCVPEFVTVSGYVFWAITTRTVAFSFPVHVFIGE